MNEPYAASSVVSRYASSPIIPQLNDRFVVGDKANTPRPAKSNRTASIRSNRTVSTSSDKTVSISDQTTPSKSEKMRSFFALPKKPKATGPAHPVTIETQSKDGGESQKRSFVITNSAATEALLAGAHQAQAEGKARIYLVPSPPTSPTENNDTVANYTLTWSMSNNFNMRQALTPVKQYSTPKVEGLGVRLSMDSFGSLTLTNNSDGNGSPAMPTTPFGSKSFTTRAIEILIEQNPNLEDELNLLKGSVVKQEEEAEDAKNAIQEKYHTKLWESFTKITKLEKGIKGKDEIIKDAYDKVDEYENQLKYRSQEIAEYKKRISDLENDMEQKDREMDLQRRQKSSMLVRLEREKRALVEQMELLDEKLETEKLKTEVKKKKGTAMKYNDAPSRHYYEDQGSESGSYFGISGENSGAAKTMDDLMGNRSSLYIIGEEGGAPEVDAVIGGRFSTLFFDREGGFFTSAPKFMVERD
jgi:hypothetical protein